MESKHKNVLIVALVAVVLVMAVGYAAFAQTLTITGTAEITSKWDVHMTQDNSIATPTAGNALATAPQGTVTVGSGGTGATGNSATFDVNLVSPGDKVVFTVPIVNVGTINAKLNSIVLSGEGLTIDNQGVGNTSTATQTDGGNIKFTVQSPTNTVLNAEDGTTSVTVTAEYVNIPEGNTNAEGESASLTVTMDYVQA